ncbi:hypothetical protein OKW88_21335 [Bacillus subtilis]|uniref:hypothetical protein n=1 Tax=Bacillus subtilis TaxID=1423 RepID=UPI00389190C2
MTETNAKIHVLADETLGGIKREYVEVDRKAEVGERIVIVEKADCEEGYKNGDVFTVDREYRPADGDVESDGASSDTNCSGLIYREEYRVLEPTDIVHIDGPDGTAQRYKLTDRKAKVGEKVLVYDPYHRSVDVEDFRGECNGEYRVLVPVEIAEADEPQPVDAVFAIGNLAQEVAKLHRRVFALELTNERQEIVNDRLKDEIDTLHKDNRTLGEELARLKEPAKNESIIESAPFVVVIHEGRGEFDVYQRGKKIENISRLEIEADSRISSSIDLEFNDVGERP